MPKIIKDKECKLSKEECDKIEALRLSSWNDTHKIESLFSWELKAIYRTEGGRIKIVRWRSREE